MINSSYSSTFRAKRRNILTFYGREKEIEALERIVKSPKTTIGVVYGRRRIGKTILIQQVQTS